MHRPTVSRLTFRGIAFLALLLCPLLCTCDRASEPEFRLRAALWANERHTWYLAMESFAAEVKQKSGGRMEVEVYPSEQLAKEIEAIRLIQAGVIDMTVTGSLLSNWIEIAAICNPTSWLSRSETPPPLHLLQFHQLAVSAIPGE